MCYYAGLLTTVRQWFRLIGMNPITGELKKFDNDDVAQMKELQESLKNGTAVSLTEQQYQQALPMPISERRAYAKRIERNRAKRARAKRSKRKNRK